MHEAVALLIREKPQNTPRPRKLRSSRWRHARSFIVRSCSRRYTRGRPPWPTGDNDRGQMPRAIGVTPPEACFNSIATAPAEERSSSHWTRTCGWRADGARRLAATEPKAPAHRATVPAGFTSAAA